MNAVKSNVRASMVIELLDITVYGIPTLLKTFSSGIWLFEVL